MKKFLCLLSSLVLVFLLASCQNDNALIKLGFLSDKNVKTEEEKNDIEYEVYLGNPEINSRRVYYFGFSSSTYEVLIQSSFINESLLSSDYESNALTKTHSNPNSILDSSKLELEYIDLSFTLGEDYVYIDGEKVYKPFTTDVTKINSKDIFKGFIENSYKDTLTSAKNAIATLVQATSSFGYIDNITKANVYYYSAGISLYNMQLEMEKTGEDTNLHKLFKSYMTDDEYETFLTFINSLGDWSGDTHPGHFSITFTTSSDIDLIYPTIKMLPYQDQEKNLSIEERRLLFFLDLTLVY